MHGIWALRYITRLLIRVKAKRCSLVFPFFEGPTHPWRCAFLRSRLQVRIIWALYRIWGRVRPVALASSTVSGTVANRCSSCCSSFPRAMAYRAIRKACAPA